MTPREGERAAAYDSAFAVLNKIDEGEDVTAPEGTPGWCLGETRGPNGERTGRCVDGLHEDLQSLDPSGREGGDLWH
jgi:hypothetical protein